MGPLPQPPPPSPQAGVPLGAGPQPGPSGQPRVCSRCGALSAADAVTCRSCGAQFAYQQPVAGPGYSVACPMTLGDAFDTVFRIYRENFGALVGAYAYYAIPMGIGLITATVCMSLAFPGLMEASGPTYAGPSATPGDILGPSNPLALAGMGIGSLVLLVAWILSGWFIGAVSIVAIQAHLGRKVTAQEAIRQAKPFMWSVLGATVVTGLATGFAVLACCVGVLWAMTAFWLAVPVIIVERAACFTAIGRSVELAHRDFWRLLLWVLLFNILVFALTLGPQFLSAVLVEVFPPALGQGIANTVSAIGELFVRPIALIASVVFYFDQRARTEGLDVVASYRALHGRPGGA